MNNLTVGIEDSFTEFAANNDIKNFKLSIQNDPSGIDQICLWYGRRIGTKQMVLLQRTPLMVACTYGSIDIVKLILSVSDSDVNRSCGQTTALHCAVSGGSPRAVDAVKLLLEAGADHGLVDLNGCRPVDVIVVSPNLHHMKSSLQELLLSTDYKRSTVVSSGKKEYPIDPTMPDINNGIYSTDEFRMYSFKIRHCSRAYSHDWTECPFVHPGENGRRRDPRKYRYSCVPCPDFRKGSCRRGDVCKYSHGVFECWLHPAQYRTRQCKDGTSCNRRVCFFAHTHDELRPLFVSPPISPQSNVNLQSSQLRSSFNAISEFSLNHSPRLETLTTSSPISTVFSPKCINHSGFQMSPRNLILAQPSDSWSQWGSSSNGKVDWAVHREEFGKICRSEEPDLSWVQSLVKESPQETNEMECSNDDSHRDPIDQAILSDWLEQAQLNQLVARVRH